MAGGVDLAEVFRTQARALRDSRVNASLLRGASTDIDNDGMMVDLLHHVVDRGARNGRVLPIDDLPSRFAAAMHAIALRGDNALAQLYPSCGGGGNLHEVWPVARELLETVRDEVAGRMIRASLRTDPARSAMLLAGLAYIGQQSERPVRIFDVGAGPGLMLASHLYRQDFFGETVGPADSPVYLGHPWAVAPAIDYADVPPVVDVTGADISALDPGSSTQVNELLAWAGPDCPEEVDRIRAACACVTNARIQVETMASSVWLPRGISWSRTDAHTVVWHSDVVLEMSVPERTELATGLLHAAALARPAAPLSVLSFEPVGADDILYNDPLGSSLRRQQRRVEPHRFELRLTQWPSATSQVLAVADPRGLEAHWVAQPLPGWSSNQS